MFQTLIIGPEGSVGGTGYCDSAGVGEGEECVGPEGFDALLQQAASFFVHTRMGASAANELDEWLSASRCRGCAWRRVRMTWNLLAVRSDSGAPGNGEPC